MARYHQKNHEMFNLIELWDEGEAHIQVFYFNLILAYHHFEFLSFLIRVGIPQLPNPNNFPVVIWLLCVIKCH